MDCKLCERPIEKYDHRFHHLKIDESHEVDICSDCIDKFTKWQGKVIADLFPTKAMKRYVQKK